MSRIGKKPIDIPKNSKITITEHTVHIEGPKGKMDLVIPCGISVTQKDGKVSVLRNNNTKEIRQKHGLIRALIANIFKGVIDGYKKELEIIGIGYKVLLKGKNLEIQLGFSHPVHIQIPDILKVTAPAPTKIAIEGCDKEAVGNFAAKIRKICPPEPYKGKGIRYTGEYVRKKLGKALAKAA